MKYQGIQKVHEGKYITRYNITYKTADDKEKVYEMISRDGGIEDEARLVEHPTDAVVIICEDPAGEKILLNKEFRMAVGKYVYNFPAGLIDPGETVQQSAARELKEETGLDLVKVLNVIPDSYSAVGFSNEKNQCVVGVAEGTFAPSTSTVEEIEAGWFTKEEVRHLLATEAFAARTQAYCYLWSREPIEK